MLARGVERNNLEFERGGAEWSPAMQARFCAERRLNERNWVGVQTTLWATDEMNSDFGAGDTDFTLAGGDLEVTYRRTH